MLDCSNGSDGLLSYVSRASTLETHVLLASRFSGTPGDVLQTG
jgi:hypothetical protein